MSDQFDVPVVLLAFNRPAATRAVLDAMRVVRPRTLLVVLDAPRATRPDDQRKCAEVRDSLRSIDWPCEIREDIATENMGARRRVASGLDWAFSQVEEAVILEDDCVPTPQFFRFCKELLERYRDDRRIMHIGGTNLAPSSRRNDASYLFSRYALSWGWATWRRAWTLYDAELEHWPKVRAEGWLRDFLCRDDAAVDSWTRRLDAVTRGEFDSWASIWMFSCWMQNALSIIPAENQIMNIGLGDEDATHTGRPEHASFIREVRPLSFPLRHPGFVFRDSETDVHLSRKPLMVKDYSGFGGYLRRLKARRVRRRDDAWRARTAPG